MTFTISLGLQGLELRHLRHLRMETVRELGSLVYAKLHSKIPLGGCIHGVTKLRTTLQVMSGTML
jgi:hypothetical protein